VTDIIYTVVKNSEEQYSIWIADRPVPAGWKPQEMQGTKEQCLAYIGKYWTDMTPASLRQAR
jgi:MbtH protein